VRNHLFGVVSACVLAPSVATAAFTLRIDDPQDPIPGNIILLRPGETKFLEVYADETGAPEMENLIAYSIGLNLPPGRGVTFGPGPLVGEEVNRTVRHPFAITSSAMFTDTGSSPLAIRVIVDAASVEDVTNNEGLLRFPITAAPTGTVGTEIPLTFQLTGGGATEFSDDIGNIIPFTAENALINWPEPAGLGLVGFAGLLLLRRRHAA
jgi:hypothetical protein